MPGNNDTGWIGQNLLYPVDDPNTAFRHAMQDIGINPYRSNPFVAQLQRAAPGARIAFLSRGAPQGPGRQGPYTNVGQDYGSYLRSALTGGNLMGELSNTAQNFYSVINQMKGYEDALARGDTGAVDRQPYFAALRDIFGEDDGMGALSAYASLRTPMLGSGIASQYTRALQAAGQGAMRNFYGQGGPQSSPWDWLFPGNQPGHRQNLVF
jgi:hypothetical protein